MRYASRVHISREIVVFSTVTFDTKNEGRPFEVQWIMASLAQKAATQATIVRKWSSYARQNQTKKAL